MQKNGFFAKQLTEAARPVTWKMQQKRCAEKQIRCARSYRAGEKNKRRKLWKEGILAMTVRKKHLFHSRLNTIQKI